MTKVLGLDLDWTAMSGAWRETSRAGVRWLPLYVEEEQHPEPGSARRSAATVLVRMDPGCGYPAHRHVGGEEVLVLCGGYADERGTWTQGDHVHYEPGSTHSPRALGDPDKPVGPDNPPCVLYATAPGGIELVE